MSLVQVIYLEAADVARELGLVPQSIRHLAKIGALRVAATTPRGVKLFRPADVEVLKHARRAAKEMAVHGR
jgi:DNA-binding transcriptional MerR regulator